MSTKKKSDIIKELLDAGVSIEDIAIQLECKESVVKAVRTKYNKEKANAEEPIETNDNNQNDDGDSADNDSPIEEIVEIDEVLDELLEPEPEADVEELPDVEEEEAPEVVREDPILTALANNLKKRGLHVKKRKVRLLARMVATYNNSKSDASYRAMCRTYSRYRRALSRVPEIENFFIALEKERNKK